MWLVSNCYSTTRTNTIGIITPSDNFLVLDGKDFNERIRKTPNGPVSQAKMDEVWPRLRVLARAQPTDKYVLVKGDI
jgi:Ca2+ transporting ATPase